MIGKVVRPKAEWRDNPNRIPSGRIVKTERWGRGHVFYVEGDHRAFVEDVFEIEVEAAE